jgi:hypothetical protein
MVFAAFHVFLAAIGQNGMMQPHACVCICGGAIRVHQVSLEPSDEAVVAWHCRIPVYEVLHPIVDMAWWNFIGTILYPGPLRLVFAKILRLEIFYIRIIGDYEAYNQYPQRI